VAPDGSCTNTVPSWPRGPGKARVVVIGTEPVYIELIVVNDCESPVLFGADIVAPDGSCTNTVPSWPRGPGKARVVVIGTEPVYIELIVVNDCESPVLFGADIVAPDGSCTNTVPSWPRGPGKARVVVIGTEPVYIELIVVNDCDDPLLLGADIANPEGTCTNTVPSCPSDPGKARVVVMGTEPVYVEVRVVKDCGSPRPTPPVDREAPDGRDAPGGGSEMPEGNKAPDGSEVPGTSTRIVVVALGSSVFAIVVVLVTEPA
jgi:hypothetical protein